MSERTGPIRCAIAAGSAAALSFAVDAGALPGQQARPPAAGIAVQKLGPQVGDRIPDFALTDQHGQRRTLASLMGPKGLVLVFYRSADW